MTTEELIEAALAASAHDRRRIVRAIAASVPPPEVAIGTSMAETEVIRLLENVGKTMQSLPPDDLLISGINDWLTDTIGSGRFPPALPGDLAHLLVTLEDLYLRLSSLSLGRHQLSKPESLAQLWALRFDLKKTLLPLWHDLRSDLKATLPTRASELQ